MISEERADKCNIYMSNFLLFLGFKIGYFSDFGEKKCKSAKGLETFHLFALTLLLHLLQYTSKPLLITPIRAKVT